MLLNVVICKKGFTECSLKGTDVQPQPTKYTSCNPHIGNVFFLPMQMT